MEVAIDEAEKASNNGAWAINASVMTALTDDNLPEKPDDDADDMIAQADPEEEEKQDEGSPEMKMHESPETKHEQPSKQEDHAQE